VEVPDSFTTPEGVEFRPNLLATTSFDGSLATTYKRVVTNVVCDNTMAAGLAESGQTYRVKHSKYSDLKALEARDALQLVHTIAADFADQVAQLTATKVSDQEWSRFLAEIIPNERDGQEMTKRARTIAEKKRMEMTTLWTQDVRVAPWKNTAFGVLQAVNTHAHHLQTVRGAGRAERNMLRTVAGDFDTLDIATLDTLHAVLT
jgi:phage/plasmid-like protein (TIGR03299 family)